jgi:DNA-binding protein YbaB
MTVTGQAGRDGVLVKVAQGGALQALTLDPEAVDLGPRGLADTILTAVREANAKATRRAALAVQQQHSELTERDLAALGLTQDTSLTEVAETTTPNTWTR